MKVYLWFLLCKNDLTYQRQVETTQGQELAKFNCKFLETVRENINVERHLKH